MHEIDLIPGDYRQRRQLSCWIKNTVLAAVAVALINLCGFGFFFHRTGQVETDIGVLQDKKAISNKQRSEMQQLLSRREELEKQWRLLTGLRSGSAVEHIFLTMDKALTGDDIWFLNWKFRRAGSLAKPEQNKVNTGYFIVVPVGEQGTKEETWRIETHMEIDGEAWDHAALSGFVKRLVDQPGIQSVRVLRSKLQKKREVKLIQFSLAITVAGGANHS